MSPKPSSCIVRFILNLSTRIIEFRGFLSQFSTNFHEILLTLFSIHVVSTLKISQSFDSILEVRPFDMWCSTLYPGVPPDMQCHLVNVAAICVATGSNIEICFTNSPYYFAIKDSLMKKMFPDQKYMKNKHVSHLFLPSCKIISHFLVPGYSDEK